MAHNLKQPVWKKNCRREKDDRKEIKETLWKKDDGKEGQKKTFKKIVEEEKKTMERKKIKRGREERRLKGKTNLKYLKKC